MVKERRNHPQEPLGQQMYREPALRFMRYACLMILASAAVFGCAVLLFLPAQALRALGPTGLALVALATWVLLARGRIRAAVHVLALGVWIVVTAIAFFTGGVTGMAIIVYPMIIFMLGWMVGARAAVAMAAVSIAATLVFVLAQTWGWLPASPPTPPLMRWFVQSAVFVFSVVMFVYFTRSYQTRLNELQRLDDDLRRAQSVAHVGSWVYDLTQDRMSLSAETCRIFGLPEGVSGSRETYLARVHPEDRARVDAAWADAIARRRPFDDEHRIITGEGVRWVRQIAEFESGADGAPVRGVGTTQDITLRRETEAALRASEERFRRLTENAPDLIYRYDFLPVRGFSYVSPAAMEITGYTPEEHYADPDLGMKLVHPEDRHLLDAFATGALPAGKPVELRWLKKDGAVVWTEQRNLPIFDAAGKLVAIEGMARDVTQRKRNEDEYRTIIQASIDGFWITDFFGRILDANESICRTLGYARDELIGMNIRDIDADESPVEIAARTRDMITTGSARFQARHRRKDGGMVHVEVSVMHVAALGDRLFAFVRDITERRRAEVARTEIEAQLRESQKMEALGTLAGGIAHDFNNIVATIIGNAELARQDVGPAHAALESLEEIRKASRRAKDLVQQILAFGRRQVLARKIISLAPAIDESVRLLRSTLPAGMELRVACAPDAPPVLADATQIEQVLLNLCSNAWQAMQARAQGGLIEVLLSSHVVAGLPYRGPERRLKGERVSLQPGRYACMTVRDNGPGMDATTRSRIFEPFFTTKPPGEGTGLGLAVVHGIVRDHEASIVVQSAPGEGATFRIYFPAADPAAALAAAPHADAGAVQTLVLQGEGRRILYLDDDEAIVFLMTRLLQRQGYRVSGFTDAHAALAAVRTTPAAFDLVVTDYNMPVMSGLDVARALQASHPDLPVALASGYITEELRAKAPAAGVRELIYKPDTAEDLCQAVARLISTLPVQ